MSIINDYKETQKALAEMQAKLERLSESEELLFEMEFEEKLRALMGEYGKSLRDIISLIDPASKNRTAEPKKTNRERAIKVYTNPNNGEVIETKGGNHKVLKQWKANYGAETVESWVSLK